MLTYLNPATLVIERAPDSTVRVSNPGDRCGINVQVLRAFPLSHPSRDIVLRDGGGTELGIIDDLAAIEPAGRALLEGALEGRYFLPKITRIDSIIERFGSSVWIVETDRGPVTIHTKAMHEAISELGASRFMVRDIEDNRYEIPDLAKLDLPSQQRFQGKF